MRFFLWCVPNSECFEDQCSKSKSVIRTVPNDNPQYIVCTCPEILPSRNTFHDVNTTDSEAFCYADKQCTLYQNTGRRSDWRVLWVLRGELRYVKSTSRVHQVPIIVRVETGSSSRMLWRAPGRNVSCGLHVFETEPVMARRHWLSPARDADQLAAFDRFIRAGIVTDLACYSGMSPWSFWRSKWSIWSIWFYRIYRSIWSSCFRWETTKCATTKGRRLLSAYVPTSPESF